MTDALSIALSGMKAASLRAGAAASNIANAGTAGATSEGDGPAPYIPQDVVQTSVAAESGLNGTSASLSPRDPATTNAYQPDAPFADAQGYVAAPNVDLGTELIDAKQAALAYKANVAVARVADEMQKELLNRFDETV